MWPACAPRYQLANGHLCRCWLCPALPQCRRPMRTWGRRFTPTKYRMYTLESLLAHDIEAERGTVNNGIDVRSRFDNGEHMLVTSYSTPSTYDRVHMVTGHPGIHGINWHHQHSLYASYTSQDAAASCPVCLWQYAPTTAASIVLSRSSLASSSSSTHTDVRVLDYYTIY